MAVITPDTFNALRRYVSVRLQQGVPLVDADWNELDDIRRFELRAFLRWFVGDGVPDAGDGFRIRSVAAADDIEISAGVTAPGDPLQFGRLLVDGLEVMIGTSVNFKSQPLYFSVTGAGALATKL